MLVCCNMDLWRFTSEREVDTGDAPRQKQAAFPQRGNTNQSSLKHEVSFIISYTQHIERQEGWKLLLLTKLLYIFRVCSAAPHNAYKRMGYI